MYMCTVSSLSCASYADVMIVLVRQHERYNSKNNMLQSAVYGVLHLVHESE